MKVSWHATLLAVGCVVLTAIAAMPCAAQVTDAQIDQAIAKGVECVWNQQQPDGRWGQYDWAGGGHYPWGRDGIALMVLEFARVPVDDERYQKGLKLILEADLEQTYERSCRAIVLAQLTGRTKGNQQAGYRAALKRDVKWIQEAQGESGGWTYTNLHGGPGYHDFSNSQMAVLALSEAIMAGVEVSPEVMKKAQDLFLKAQRPDGGWNYRVGDTKDVSYGSMTAAAVATLFITRDYLTPQVGCPCRSGRSPRRDSAADKAIDAGVKWLAGKFVADNNPDYHTRWWVTYWLYSVARVGVASGYKYLGTHNWYREGAGYAVHQTVGGGQNFPYACMATLFLIKGKAPLLASKLQWDGDWNLHPRDLANLTQYLSKLKEQPIGWQIIPVEVPLEEWHEAPILYISAEEKIDLTDEQKQKFRRFAETGGTILFEASCGNRTARAWWENLCKELWPEYEFQRVAPQHPLWTADARIERGRVPVLFGLSDSLRTFVFLAPTDISCSWCTRAHTRQQNNFLLGTNLYAYATDKGPLRARLAGKREKPEQYRSARIAAGPKAALRIARLKTSGDYYAGANYHPLERYNADRDKAAPELKIADPVGPADVTPEALDVLWLTGRQSAALSDEAAEAVKAFLAGGGFLFAEAALGDERFQKSFAETAERLGLTLKPWAQDAAVVTGRMDGASGYDVSNPRFATHLRARRIGRGGPALEGIYLGSKLVGVYSPYDVMFSQTGCKAYGNLGYEEDDARAVATNILLLATCKRE